MHPDLLNNDLFLRYYKQWQDDPQSIVFAPIAEYFLNYGLVDDAQKVCREGLKKHPYLVSGRIVMAKVLLKRGNWEEAEDEIRAVLAVSPENPNARAILGEISALRNREETRIEDRDTEKVYLSADEVSAGMPSSWNTLTMANIYASQGHFERARNIYRSILDADPTNEEARRGLGVLPVTI